MDKLQKGIKMPKRLFVVKMCGDPFSSTWDCHEYENSFNDDTCVFRGDLSGLYHRDRLIATLRQLYPSCKIRKA